jgi:hypothetical protein
MRIITLGILLAGFLMVAPGAMAKDNFCAECHTQGEIAATGNLMEWDASIHQVVGGTICPGVLELKKEAYFTESRLAKYDVSLTDLEHSMRRWPENMRTDLTKQNIKYAEMKNLPHRSINSMSGKNLKIKKGMHGVYEKLNKLRGDYGMEKVLGYSLVGTMIIMFMMFLALKNTLKE